MKRAFLLHVLLLGVSCGYCQEWERLHKQAEHLYKEKKYQDAIPVYRRALQAAATEFGERHRNYVRSLLGLADTYDDLNNFVDAGGLYKDVLDRQRDITGEEHSDYARVLLRLGILYYEKLEEIHKADSVYSRYRDIILKIEGKESIEYAVALNTLANVYTTLEKYKEAEMLYMEARNIRKKRLGATHQDYLSTVKNLGSLYHITGQYHYAIPFFDEWVNTIRKTGGKPGRDFALVLYDLGKALLKEEIYVRADTVLSESAPLLKEFFGEKSDEYFTCINELGILYTVMNQFGKANLWLQRVRAGTSANYGDTSLQMAAVNNNLGFLHYRNREWERAAGYYGKAAEIHERTGETQTGEYATLLHNLGQVYVAMGKDSLAEDYYLHSLSLLRIMDDQPSYELVVTNMAGFYETKISLEKAEDFLVKETLAVKDLHGIHSRKYIFLMTSQAGIYSLTGRNEEAEIHYRVAAEQSKEWLGEKDPLYAWSLQNLARFYFTAGRYDKGLTPALDAGRIYQERFGPGSRSFISSMYVISDFYYAMGQYQLALDLNLEMLHNSGELYGTVHKEYALSLNRAGGVYYAGRNYDSAYRCFNEARKIISKTTGVNSPEYFNCLNNIALIHMQHNANDSAAALLKRVRNYFKNKPAGQEAFIAATGNLAVVYMETGKYREAEMLLKESLELKKMLRGKENKTGLTEKGLLFRLYMAQGDSRSAWKMLDTLNRDFTFTVSHAFPGLSEAGKTTYMEKHEWLNDYNNSLLWLDASLRNDLGETAWNHHLLVKSASLADTRNMLEFIRQSPDSALCEKFADWMETKRKLAYIYSHNDAQKDSILHSLLSRAEALERDLNLLSADFRIPGQPAAPPIRDIQHKMDEDEALIEFVRFNLYNKNWSDSTVYAAYILTKKDPAPVFVPLFEERPLQGILDKAGNSSTAMVNNIYRGLDIKNKSAGTIGAELYKLFWAPLEPHLKGIRKVGYSPAGKLHGIAFHALPVDSNVLLMDKYALQSYTSIRQVMQRKEQETRDKMNSITLFGDASFTMDSAAIAGSKMKSENAYGIYIPPNRGNRGGNWQNLPGTGEEVRKIRFLFEKNKISTQTFVQTTASEENLKALSGRSPQVLHIATHGFFLPEPDKKRKEAHFSNENSYTLADDPLVRNGLILAGGNHAWSGKKPVAGAEDGIVTAYEISQLDLSKTELVVLSACETALGDVKGSEGVFGLQRAFKLAGVKKMIVSLWQVPDKETAELMTAFYGYWLKGKTIQEAFTRAQADMRKKYPPFYWAAFVLVE